MARGCCITRRALLAGAGTLAAAGVLAGCGGASEHAAATASTDVDASRQVTIAMSTENEPAAGFNPCVDWGCGEHVHEPLIQPTLIVTDEDMNFVNDLATG